MPSRISLCKIFYFLPLSCALLAPSTLAASFDGGTIHVDATCSLSDAILAAQTDTVVGGCTGAGGIETLVLDTDLTLTTADDSVAEIDGFSALPRVTGQFTIQAGTGSRIERDPSLGCEPGSADPFRFLSLSETADLTIEGIEFHNGCAAFGGAIHVDRGRLTLVDTRFVGNVARVVDGASGPQAASGGAIFLSGGDLSATGSVFESNAAFGGFGDGFSNHGGGNGEGGAIAVVDATERLALFGPIDACEFVGNRASGGTQSPLGIAGFGLGGALALQGAQTLPIVDSVFTDNQAEIFAYPEQTGGDVRGGAIFFSTPDAGHVLEIQNSHFEANRATGSEGRRAGAAYGGAIHGGRLRLTDVAVVGNTARGGDGALGGIASGGGVYATRLEVDGLRVTGNQAIGGDVIQTEDQGAMGGWAFGGGVWVREAPPVQSRRVTLDSNTARGGTGFSGGGGRAFGGGLYSTGLSQWTHLTLSGNTAEGGASVQSLGGGAIGGGTFSSAVTTLASSTVTGNRAIAGTGALGEGFALGGGLYFEPTEDETLSVRSSILSGNVTIAASGTAANDCDRGDVDDTSWGHNLVGAPGLCGFTDVGDRTGLDPSLDPQLDALADLGCPNPMLDGTCPPVHALRADSPALDQGSCFEIDDLFDGRGGARPIDQEAIDDLDDGCDIGAYEALDASAIFSDGFESGGLEAWSVV